MRISQEIDSSKLKFFQKNILSWYSENGRDFVWRKKSITNYEIIIAEIFLQRTKAESVNKFIPWFLKKYPSWKQLGKATELELQSILKPLGLYNQRGTRLFKLAQELKKRHGILPRRREIIEEMPMMGQYITNAFELYILKKPAPLLDVNMARVLERFFEPRKLADIRYDPFLQSLAKIIVKHKYSKELNWGILDLASIVCKINPQCTNCPMMSECNYLKC
jgi:A/G-specific adenine glycosylase